MRTWWRRLLDWFRQLGQEPGPAGLRLAADELAARRRTLAAAALRAELPARRAQAPSFVVTPAVERAVGPLRPAVALGAPVRPAVPMGPPPRPWEVLAAAPLTRLRRVPLPPPVAPPSGVAVVRPLAPVAEPDRPAPPPSVTQEIGVPVVWTFPAAWAVPEAELPIEFQAPEPAPGSSAVPPADVAELEEEEVPIEFLPPDPQPVPGVAAPAAAEPDPGHGGPAARGTPLRTPTRRGGLGVECRPPARRLRPGAPR
jgi:hypothetical protein